MGKTAKKKAATEESLEDIAKLKQRTRKAHRTLIKRAVAEAKDLLAEEYDKGDKEQKLKAIQLKETLEEQLEITKKIDEDILNILVQMDDATDDEIAEEVQLAGELRGEIKALITSLSDLLTQQTEAPANAAPLTSQTMPGPSKTEKARARLPKLEVKKFTGRFHEWQEFWDSYRSAIHSNDSLSKVDKFSYLRGLVEGPAKTCIAGFALTEANYNAAIELLERRFGKKIAIERAHISELLNVQPVYSDREPRRLRTLYDKVESHYRGLVAIGVDERTYSGIVVPSILGRLPDTLRLTITRGEEYLEWSLGDLLGALLKEVELREDYSLTPQVNVPPEGNRRKVPPPTNSFFTNNQKRSEGRCAFCLGNHPHEECKGITDIEERKLLVRKYGRCFKCLNRGHLARDCQSKFKCHKCKGNHHVSLCETKPPEPSGGGSGQSTGSAVSAPNSMLVGTESRIALQTAQALIKGERQGRIRVLFDSGSHRSFITAKAASSYGLGVVRKEWLSICTFGQRVKESGLREVVRFDVTPLQGDKALRLEAYVVPAISHISNEHVEVVKNDFPHLRDLWFSDVCKTKEQLEIDLLIGADYLWEFQKGTTRRGESEEPVAIETELGWVLSGPLKRKEADSKQEVSVNFIAQDSTAIDRGRLENEVNKLWDLDSLGIKVNDEVHETFEDDIEFRNGRYSVKLPWKQGHDSLPSNYGNSLSRMRGQLKRLRKEPDVLDEYDSIIREQLKSGVIEKVAELEESDKVHYLPHQAVIRRDATTTKLRIVYDASSKESKNGTSLNDCLHTGPSLNPLLFNILVRFRENRIALVGDIEKAFLNIGVDEKDRDFLRFLWVEDVRDNNLSINVYRFCRVVFGLNASPFLLNGTIRHHLATFAVVDPEFVKRMVEGFYVDDLVTGDRTTERAFTLYEKAKERMATGGFKLRKWKTNDPGLREKIGAGEASTTKREVGRLEDEESYAKSKLEPQSGTKGERVLGLAWNCESDTIHFNLAHVADKARGMEATKRNVLSLLASLFDPLGIISPVTVSMKILFQEICNSKIDWDEVLTGEIKRKWDRWVQDLSQTGEIQIKRCLYETGGESVTECYLHGFGDASKKAYCAMVYLAYRTEDGKTHVRLVASKTRVAPLKELSIPRLELMSARILAQLVNTIKNALSSQLEVNGVRYWLDSKTALSWIQNKGEWKQFVRHRVNEILRLGSKVEWSYCPTEENPADIGSRGAIASQLKEDELWWQGPQWLSGNPQDWPKTTETLRTPESSEEEKKSSMVLLTETKLTTGIATVVNANDYSTLQRLVTVTAWVIRAVDNFKASSEQRRTGKLKVTELKNAEMEWIRSAQGDLKKQDNFKQLVSELGVKEDGGILRCVGRLVNSDLDFDARRPVVLPRQHRLTRLIIEECHKRVQHSGVRATLAELRSKYWVPKGRQVVKKVRGECIVCKKLVGKPYNTPPTAALPDFRVREAPPFSRVGVDFAGPFYVKGRLGQMDKAYVALFSCCVTRAVHLELVEDLSAEAFRRCLRKFIARCGRPELIVSDNAKTFQATEKALNKLFNHPEIKADLEYERIEWKFNLERAPWWGGFFERMVASVKECLRKVLGNARLSFDELSTLLTEVESTLNSRPLTYEYEEAEEEVLTPSHLIYGRRLKTLPDDIVEPDDAIGEDNCSSRFKYLSTRLQHFWNRWRKEYLANLREFHRCKSGKQERKVEIGDVVVVYEEEKKRGDWKMGVVKSLVTGKDGVVRGAEVRVITKGKPVHLSRPVQKLYPLEVRSEGEGHRETGARNRDTGNPTRNVPRRNAALNSRCKSQLMLDS